MASSGRRGPWLDDQYGGDPGGPLGLLGGLWDTPGPVGMNDWADPDVFMFGTTYCHKRRIAQVATELQTPTPAQAPAAPVPVAARFGRPAGRIPVPERSDPGADTLTGVNRYGEDAARGERVFRLTAEALAAFQALRAAALEAGHDRELFTLTSAYRSAGRQAELAQAARERYGSAEAAAKWVAQGVSEHVTGRAFDLNLGIGNSSENAKDGAFEHLESYIWMRDHAAEYGLNAYSAEPWHWSYNVVAEQP